MVCHSSFRGAALACLIAFSWPAFAGAQSAPVSRVVLYPGSALVERVATVKAGDQSLDIQGLPANFDADSVQIEADSGIEVGEVVWRDSARSAPLNAEEARLEKEVQRLTDRIASLDVERKTAELMLKYLDTLASPSDAGPAGNPARTLETIRQGSLQSQRRILEIDQQKRDIERELQARQRDLERIRPAVAEVRNLSIRLNARNDGRLRLRYLFADAGWRPAYRASLDSETSKVELERIAQIAQRSGEDWSQVSLQLSTGQPRQRIAGLQPYSWGLSLQQERRAEAMAYPMAPAPAPMAMRAKGGADAAAKPLFEVSVAQSEYATEYAIPGAVSLPADGRKVAVSLGRSQIPVVLQAQVSPRQEKAAYLVASGALPEGVWPVGEMQFYRNGAYIGTSNWDASRSTKLELPFGRDELIRVSSRSLAADNASAGFVGQKSERRIADVFTVTNRHKRPVDVLVLDASPVSHDEQIEVESRFTPPVVRKDWNDRQGVVAWEQRVEAGAAAEFTADYRIRWPKERRVVGLP
jgi:uncharacterized protein (TIGR02231 family)